MSSFLGSSIRRRGFKDIQLKLNFFHPVEIFGKAIDTEGAAIDFLSAMLVVGPVSSGILNLDILFYGGFVSFKEFYSVRVGCNADNLVIVLSGSELLPS